MRALQPADLASHAALFTLEALLVALLLFGLFRLREWTGLGPLFVAIGVLQQMQVQLALSLYVELPFGLTLSPGSVVLFPAGLFALLLVYIREDALEARKLVYGLLAANLVLSALSALFGLHLRLDSTTNLLGLPAELFSLKPRVLISGTLVLFVDAVLLMTLYEALGRRGVRSLFLRIFLTLELVLAFDTLAFTTAAFVGRAPLAGLFASHLLGKSIAALFYSGLLALYLRRAEPTVPQLGLSRHLGDVFALLSYREKYEHLQREVVRDPLTGVFNRRFFDDILPREVEIARRSNRPLSLALVDIDDFKSINDLGGHAAGDRALVAVAGALEGSVRSSDLVCRIGGDEFALLLPYSDLDSATRVVEKARGAISDAARGIEPPLPRATLTCSAGVASFPGDAPGMRELSMVADARLYDGKRRGRDRTVGA